MVSRNWRSWETSDIGEIENNRPSDEEASDIGSAARYVYHFQHTHTVDTFGWIEVELATVLLLVSILYGRPSPIYMCTCTSNSIVAPKSICLLLSFVILLPSGSFVSLT
jgi:hypothetical protein